MTGKKVKVLVCGHRSFAAKGLISALRRAGHEVVAFSRGPVAQHPEDFPDAPAVPVVTGPVEAMFENPHLATGEFDAVVNYILLKDDGVDKNLAFIASLLRFCREQPVRPVQHLVHISSISSYKASVRLVDESAEIETVPERKGSYGSLKVATDLYLLQHAQPEMKLSLIRPGFVLGVGLVNPIVGTAARLPWNKLIVIGNGKSIIPMTTRELVNEAVARVVSSPPAGNREVLVLADPDSPTRSQFLEACCRELGIGTGVTSLPTPFWWLMAVGGEAVARLIGQGKLQPYSKLTARLARQRFNSALSSKRLGMSLSVDWCRALRDSLEKQNHEMTCPQAAAQEGQAQAQDRLRLTEPVTFIGFGRIVRQKYLPGLKKLGFSGQIRAFDLNPAEATAETNDLRVEPVSGATIPASGLVVIASPGPAHTEAIGLLRNVPGVLLVEKPLCYAKSELREWSAFAAQRRQPIYVCHNYRFKQNVRRMMAHLAQFNPGCLHHAELQFQSPPAANDSVPWLREERRARTLLMDYAIHFLDIACLFGPGRVGTEGTPHWKIGDLRHELTSSGQTGLIEGRVQGDYSVHFLLRQGFGPRRARVRFSFQNYSVSLGFFPDTFVACMADDNPWIYKAEAAESRRATLRKIVDKLRNRDSDDSHVRLLAGVAAQSKAVEGLTVGRLAPFYEALFEIGDSVYGH